MKVMTILGTRPEIIRLSRIIPLLDKYCDHVLVHTGQNFDFELNEIFFTDLEVRKPDIFLNAAGESAAATIGRVIQGADRALATHNPEALLVLGDTNSCLAAIAAKRRKVPIFHMEAGNRCFDFRVPEETNRRIVDHVADVNLTYSDIAREYLLREGFPPDRVINTGSPLREVIGYYSEKVAKSEILSRMGLLPGRFYVVSFHREENVDDPAMLARLHAVLDMLARRNGDPIIVSTHPRTRKQIESLGLEFHPAVRLCRPFGYTDYLKLQCTARCVLSDSGTITEESSILNFPALNLRESHERPEGFLEGSVMLVGLSVERILEGLAILADQPRGDERLLQLVVDYAPENVSAKILRIIQSYTDYVNRNVWRR